MITWGIIFWTVLIMFCLITFMIIVGYTWTYVDMIIDEDCYYTDYTHVKHISFSQWKKFYLISEKHWDLDDLPCYKSDLPCYKKGSDRYVIYFNYFNYIIYSCYAHHLRHSSETRKNITITSNFLSTMRKELDNFEEENTKDLLNEQLKLEKLLKINE